MTVPQGTCICQVQMRSRNNVGIVDFVSPLIDLVASVLGFLPVIVPAKYAKTAGIYEYFQSGSDSKICIRLASSI